MLIVQIDKELITKSLIQDAVIDAYKVKIGLPPGAQLCAVVANDSNSNILDLHFSCDSLPADEQRLHSVVLERVGERIAAPSEEEAAPKKKGR